MAQANLQDEIIKYLLDRCLKLEAELKLKDAIKMPFIATDKTVLTPYKSPLQISMTCEHSYEPGQVICRKCGQGMMTITCDTSSASKVLQAYKESKEHKHVFSGSEKSLLRRCPCGVTVSGK